MADLNTEGINPFIYPVLDAGLSDSASMEHDLNRLSRYALSWNFYYTKHWTFEREDGEPLVTINYLKALIDKKISFLIGNGFTLNVPAALQSVTMPVLQKAWDDNGRQRLGFEIVQEGSVTGDCFILVTVGPPTREILKFDPLAKYRIIINRLSSHECFPVWDPATPPDRYGRRMLSFTVVKKLRRLKAGSTNSFENVDWTMQITPDSISTQIGDAAPITKPNRLGEIPVVHIPNKVASRTLFGIDDATDLIPLNREYNEKSTDISDAINYNSNPVTVIVGARARALERGPRAIWSGLPKDAKVTLLKLEGEFTAAVSYLDRIKKAMHEIAGVPEGSLGQMQPITGTSGDTLHMTYAPLVDERNKKKATYEPGLERVNYYVLRYAEEYQDLRLPMGLCEKCGGKIAIVYVQDPEDPENQIEVRRCYEVDPETFDFLDPNNKKISVLRQLSFGTQLVDITRAEAEQDNGMVNSSFWDPEPTRPDPALMADWADPNATKNPAAPPSVTPNPNTGEAAPPPPAAAATPPAKPQLPEGFTLPPEPEILDLPEVVVAYEDILDANGKPLTVLVQRERSGIKAIPVECDQHSFLSPYTNYVSFNDTLPKDKAAQANLMTQYDALKVVSKAWIMSEIGVENIPAMQEQILREQHSMLASQANKSAIKPMADPGVVHPSHAALHGVPRGLRASRPPLPGVGESGSGSRTSTSG